MSVREGAGLLQQSEDWETLRVPSPAEETREGEGKVEARA